MKSLAPNSIPTQGISILVLPHMTCCQLIQYHKNAPPPSRLLQHSRERGLGHYIPVNEQDFRSFWKNVHGITLPEDLGGYAEVIFANGSSLIYPASCAFLNCHIVHQLTRATAVTTMRDFGIKLKHGFGEDQVKIHSPIDKERKQAVFLPASALMMPVSSCDVPSNSKPLPHHVKNRRTSSIILKGKRQ